MLCHDMCVDYIITAILLCCGLWLYSYFTCGICKSRVKLTGKTVIITGCDSGIGKETALDLARRGARLIMACQFVERAHYVKESIVEATKNHNIVVKAVDLSSLSSVRKFAEDISRTEKRLDILIHNAGVSAAPVKMTDEGLSGSWTINHFGPFLLTHLLIDLLKKTRKSRVVVVSSVMHVFGQVDPSNPNPLGEKSQRKSYCGSKLANILFTNELSRRLEGSGVTANSLHPGFVNTPIWKQCPLWCIPLVTLLKPFFKTPEQGAQTTIYLAVSEEVEGISGKYFADCKVCPTLKKTKDRGLAKKYWEKCEEVVQLKASDPHI